MSGKFAPKREDGLMAYVITKRSWGRSWSRIEWASSLRDAKAEHGFTRELHTSIAVRRATAADLQEHAGVSDE
jgi:hypothetical protein